MNIGAIIIAALVVGGSGILLGLFLGIFGEKFKVEVDERAYFPAITAAAADMPDVPVLRQPL